MVEDDCRSNLLICFDIRLLWLFLNELGSFVHSFICIISVGALMTMYFVNINNNFQENLFCFPL